MTGQGKGWWPLSPLEVTSARGEEWGKCNMAATPLSVSDDQEQEPVVRAQIPNIWKTESVLPNLASTNCVQAAPGTYAIPAMQLGGGMDSCYRAKSRNRLKIATISVHDFLWKLQAFQSIQSSEKVTSDKFCQDYCCLGVKTDSWHFDSTLFPESHGWLIFNHVSKGHFFLINLASSKHD